LGNAGFDIKSHLLLYLLPEFYLQLVKRSDLKYMESDIKVYAKKYSNTWGVIQDYTINNAIFHLNNRFVMNFFWYRVTK